MTKIKVDQRTATQRANIAAWRSALATGVASAAVLAYCGRPVRAQTVPPATPCNQISGPGGSVVTCSGDLSAGVLLNNAAGPYSVLNVNNLTTNITPATGVYGIAFTSYGPVAMNINTGAFNIVTTGDGAIGVFGSSAGVPGPGGPVTINSTANISTSGNFASAIVAGSPDAFAVQVIASGLITTTGNNSNGISVGSIDGDISIRSFATISTAGDSSSGIVGSSITGNIGIVSTGDIATVGDNAFGIAAGSSYGAVPVTSAGNIATEGTFAAGINVGTVGTFGTDDHVYRQHHDRGQ